MTTPKSPKAEVTSHSSSGSIAHSIVGVFITELGKQEGFAEIAKALEAVVYDSPSEVSVRAALFGEEIV